MSSSFIDLNSSSTSFINLSISSRDSNRTLFLEPGASCRVGSSSSSPASSSLSLESKSGGGNGGGPSVESVKVSISKKALLT